jgi:isochorismate synthase
MTFAHVDDAPAALAPIDRALRRARQLDAPVAVCLIRPIAPPDDLLPLVARAHAAGRDAALWERPGDGVAIAALGAAWRATAQGADRFRALAAASTAVSASALITTAGAETTPLFFCSAAFAGDAAPAGPWSGFPAAQVVLPELAIVRRGAVATLIASAVVAPRADARAVARRLAGAAAWLDEPAVERRDGIGTGDVATRYQATATPAPARWKRSVAAAVADIGAGRFAKLVLARACRLTATRDFDCARAAARLRQAYPTCTTFWIATAAGSFVGATPERLVRVEGRRVRTGAIAGSAPRGTTPAADRALAQALLDSAKDRHEHAIVVDAITAALRPLCERLGVGAVPQVLPLLNVQHLMTPIEGTLAAGRDTSPGALLDLVERLHPTPAVAGHPRATALAEIAARESFDRGWYAGPIGWLNGHGDGELVVAIRSALVRGRQAWLYAGAGIVAGSDPDAELAETRLKLQPLLAALMEL